MAKAGKRTVKAAKKKASPRKAPSLATLSLPQQAVKECLNAVLILKHAHESAEALLKAHDLAKEQRGRPRGMTTDEEQDLLRAMLVMAGAGLDSMVKRLIRDTLPSLASDDEKVQQGLEKFIRQSIKGESEAPEVLTGTKFLARVLARRSPQDQIVEEYIQELTRGSLQSPDALARTISALGLDADELGIDYSTLRSIFDVRNSIIHELDINLSAKRRIRNIRRITKMKNDTTTLLQTGGKILQGVNAKLT